MTPRILQRGFSPDRRQLSDINFDIVFLLMVTTRSITQFTAQLEIPNQGSQSVRERLHVTHRNYQAIAFVIDQLRNRPNGRRDDCDAISERFNNRHRKVFGRRRKYENIRMNKHLIDRR